MIICNGTLREVPLIFVLLRWGVGFKNLLSLIYLKMAFNPQDFVTPYVTLEEVLDIKKGFDLFDRDLGGAIDPRGT